MLEDDQLMVCIEKPWRNPVHIGVHGQCLLSRCTTEVLVHRGVCSCERNLACEYVACTICVSLYVVWWMGGV